MLFSHSALDRDRGLANIMKTLISFALFSICLPPLWGQSYDEQLTRARAAIAEKRYSDAASAAEQAIKAN
jgi:hypothetical protein